MRASPTLPRRRTAITAALLCALLSLGLVACEDDDLDDPGVGPGAEEGVDLGDPEAGDPASDDEGIGDPADPDSELEGLDEG